MSGNNRLGKSKATLFLAVALSSNANATTLSSLEALLPFYIAAIVLSIGLFLVLPIWLVFRARRQHAKGSLTRGKLIAHLAPAGIIGFAGIVNFFTTPTFIPLLTAQLGGYMALEFYVQLLLILWINYLVWSTFLRCRGPVGEQTEEDSTQLQSE